MNAQQSRLVAKGIEKNETIPSNLQSKGVKVMRYNAWVKFTVRRDITKYFNTNSYFLLVTKFFADIKVLCNIWENKASLQAT